jgi:hypothetical protein
MAIVFGSVLFLSAPVVSGATDHRQVHPAMVPGFGRRLDYEHDCLPDIAAGRIRVFAV